MRRDSIRLTVNDTVFATVTYNDEDMDPGVDVDVDVDLIHHHQL